MRDDVVLELQKGIKSDVAFTLKPKRKFKEGSICN